MLHMINSWDIVFEILVSLAYTVHPRTTEYIYLNEVKINELVIKYSKPKDIIYVYE